MNQAISYVALVMLMLLSVFFILKNYYESKLINKAAQVLSIPSHMIHFFRVDLLSLYKHQPILKQKEGFDFLYLVKLNDLSHLLCIENKIKVLEQREEEYGEGFFEESSYMHSI